MLLHFSTLSCSHWQLRMLILGKSHSLVESRNSRRGAITGRSPMLFPADAGTPLTDRHSRQWRARNVVKRPVGGYRGARPGKRNGRSASGQWARNRHPPQLLENWSTSRAHGCTEWRAAARSPVPWHACRNAGWECDGGMQSPTGPRVWETTAPAPVGRHLGDLSCFL